MAETSRREHQVGKVVVLGLDGGTWSVLEPLLEDGQMPTLKALRDGGCWGALNSTLPPLTAPAWASFITGKNPGKHGVYQFAPVDRSLYQGNVTRIVNSRTLEGSTLWDLLGAAGKRVGVMNVPLTYPPSAVNGFMVTGMLTPRQSERFTHPPELSSRLKDYTIDVSMGESKYGVLSGLNTSDAQALERLIGELKTLVAGRTAAALELLNDYSPDFFILLFTETDRLQHIFWPHLDPRGSTGEGLREAVVGFFRHLDAHLDKLVRWAGQDAVIIVMSDHGFGPSTSQNVNFNVWLRNQGHLTLKNSPRSTLNPRRWLRSLGLSKEGLYRLLGGLFPSHTIRKMSRTWGKVVSKPIDWAATRAIFIPMFEFVGGIQIIDQRNSEGHSRLNGAAYEHFRTRLINDLQKLQDPHTHGPIVSNIYRREDLYNGPHTQAAPDIVFLMAENYRGERGLLSTSLVTEISRKVQLWSGTHRREGLVVLNGPSIVRGKLNTVPAIEDLAPTILYLLAADIPEDMDGTIIEEAIEPSLLKRRCARYSRPAGPEQERPSSVTVGLTREETEKIQKHLENLGYL